MGVVNSDLKKKSHSFYWTDLGKYLVKTFYIMLNFFFQSLDQEGGPTVWWYSKIYWGRALIFTSDSKLIFLKKQVLSSNSQEMGGR